MTQRSVYTTRRSYTHWNPVVGFPHHNPRHSPVSGWHTSCDTMNLDTSIVCGEILHSENSFFGQSPPRTRLGGWDPKGVIVLGVVLWLKIQITITNFQMLKIYKRGEISHVTRNIGN